ncbi:hypothetical protein J4408_03410 [Candidatus Pacearchaeota archaeon]|nr:hypothetical protein [Candidatus Pacearchaeota archaeon]
MTLPLIELIKQGLELPGMKVIDCRYLFSDLFGCFFNSTPNEQTNDIEFGEMFYNQLFPLISKPDVVFVEECKMETERYFSILRNNLRKRRKALAKRKVEPSYFTRENGINHTKVREYQLMNQLLHQRISRRKGQLFEIMNHNLASKHIPNDIKPYLSRIEGAFKAIANSPTVRSYQRGLSKISLGMEEHLDNDSKMLAKAYALSYLGPVNFLTTDADMFLIAREFYFDPSHVARRYQFDDIELPEHGINVVTRRKWESMIAVPGTERFLGIPLSQYLSEKANTRQQSPQTLPA